MAYRSPATRRYLKRFVPTMIAYVIVLFACTRAIREWEPEGIALITLSVLPALPIIVCLGVIGFYIAEEPDEYIKGRIVTAMMWGTGAVLAVATVLGFLQIGKVIGQVDVFWAFPLWCATWGLVQCFMALRDHRSAER